jgi:hypothetical protein
VYNLAVSREAVSECAASNDEDKCYANIVDSYQNAAHNCFISISTFYGENHSLNPGFSGISNRFQGNGVNYVNCITRCRRVCTGFCAISLRILVIPHFSSFSSTSAFKWNYSSVISMMTF